MVGSVLRSLASAISTTLGASVVGWADRQARQRRLRRPPLAELLVALLATRLSAIAYVATRSELQAALKAPALAADIPGGLQLLHFRQQRPEQSKSREMHPQWFLCRGAMPKWWDRHETSSPPAEGDGTGSNGEPAGGVDGLRSGAGSALYLVFRGTSSTSDVIRDLCMEPEEFRGQRFHGGFLRGVREDPDLLPTLRRALKDGDCERLFVFGHSLGGSLAMTLATSGLVPTSSAGRDAAPPVTVVAVGAPPVLQVSVARGRPPSDRDGKDGPVGDTARAEMGAGGSSSKRPGAWDEGDADADAPSSAPVPPGTYLLVVNDCDVVPRLLGSPMPVAIAALLQEACVTNHGQAVMQRHVELLETMQGFEHPPGTRAIFLREGDAKAVPSRDRSAVLHLHEALSPSLLDAHYPDKYERSLETAAALAEAFEG